MTLDMGVPPRVARFYGNIGYALDVIRNRQLAFVHVSVLNDPFGPYCFFETDFEDNYMNLLKYVKQDHPKEISWFRAQVTAESWGKTVRDIKAFLDALRKQTFMLSTSAPLAGLHPKDNLYMWGHYGCGHRGLAIEFDTDRVAVAVLSHHEIENGAPLSEQFRSRSEADVSQRRNISCKKTAWGFGLRLRRIMNRPTTRTRRPWRVLEP
jgi:hypothetical protein